MISTGGDYDSTLGQAVPGISIHHYGLDLIAVVSTGEDVWELKVRRCFRYPPSFTPIRCSVELESFLVKEYFSCHFS